MRKSTVFAASLAIACCVLAKVAVHAETMPKPAPDAYGLSFGFLFTGVTDGSWTTAANWTVNEGYQSEVGPTLSTVVPAVKATEPLSETYSALLFDGDRMSEHVAVDTDGKKLVTSPNSDANDKRIEGWAVKFVLTNNVRVVLGKLLKLQSDTVIAVDETSQLVVGAYGNGQGNGNKDFYINSPSGILFNANYNAGGAAATYRYHLGAKGSVQYQALSGTASTHAIADLVLDLGDAALTGKSVASRKLVGFTARGNHTFSAVGATVTAKDSDGSVATALASGSVTENDAVGSYYFHLENDGYYVDYVAHDAGAGIGADGLPPILSIAATEADGVAVLGTDYSYDSTSNIIWVLTGTPMTISTGGNTLAARIKVKSGIAANLTLNNCVLAPQKRIDENNEVVYEIVTNHAHKGYPLWGYGDGVATVDLAVLNPIVYDSSAGRAIDIEGASLTLNVEGVNTLTAADYSTAIFCPQNTSLTIQGSGTLNVNTGRYLGTAGIGGEALIYESHALSCAYWSGANILKYGEDKSGNTSYVTNDVPLYVFLGDNDKLYEWRGDELWQVKERWGNQVLNLSMPVEVDIETAIAQGIIARTTQDEIVFDLTGYRIWNTPSDPNFYRCVSGAITIREATVNVSCPCEIMRLPKYYPGTQMNIENLSVGIGGFGGGPIRIESGNVKVETGYKSQGIGSLVGSFGGIYITGGTVIANCGYNVSGASAFIDLTEDSTFGSGIGWGSYNAVGDCNVVIEIGDANVTASASWGGAGIGGGRNGKGSRIRIYGDAVVNATGGYFAAGLGGGCEHAVGGAAENCGTGRIIIEGNAKVTATGGNSAPGIGSGYAQYAPSTSDAASGEIIIRGNAKVTATGGTGGPGIGSGKVATDGVTEFPLKNYTAAVQGIKIYGDASVTASGSPNIGPSYVSGGAMLSNADRFLQYINLSSKRDNNTTANAASNTLEYATSGTGYVCSGVVTVPDDLAATLEPQLDQIDAGREGSKILCANGSQLWPVIELPPAISINFTHNNAKLSSSDEIGYFPVAANSWVNIPGQDATGVATSFDGCTVTISGSRGSYAATSLNSGSNMLHGYIDENSNLPNPTVTVSGIPYDAFRVVVYHSSDTANYRFGYDTIGGVNYSSANSGMSDRGTFPTVKNSSNCWGATGAKDTAHSLCEGVNYLVSDVITGTRSVTVVGHRVDSQNARGCIAAIQIVKATVEQPEWPELWANQEPTTEYTEKFAAWKAAHAQDMTTFTAAHEKAFLLGIDATDEEPTLDVEAITLDGNGNVTISTDVDLSTVYGAVYVLYGDTPTALNHAKAITPDAGNAVLEKSGPAKFYRVFVGYGAPVGVQVDE